MRSRLLLRSKALATPCAKRRLAFGVIRKERSEKLVELLVRLSTGRLTTTKLKTRTRAARCRYYPVLSTLQVVLHLGRIGRCQTDPILAIGSVSREVLIVLAEIDAVSAVGLLLCP